MSFLLNIKNTDNLVSTPSLTLPPDLLAQAFPFHLVFNREQQIIQVGEVLERVSVAPLVGSKLEEHFCIERPKIKVDFAAIHKRCRSVFLLKSLDSGMQLKGQMLYIEEQDLMFFLCSLWVTDINALKTFNVTLKDFAIHDPIVDFLFLLQAQNTALADTKKLADKLTQQQAKLTSTLKIKANLAEIAKAQSRKLEQTLQDLQNTQVQLIQTEKMSSLGQMVAGIAHEINNPVNFISANLSYLQEYAEDLLGLVQLYQKHYPEPVAEIEEEIFDLDVAYLVKDFQKILGSIKVGTHRIQDIIKSLRNFSRLDEAPVKRVDIHEGIDSTLMILQNRLKADGQRPEVKVIKKYGQLPLIDCYASQLNQVFMNIIVNAIDAFEESLVESNKAGENQQQPQICIRTEALEHDWVTISIADNGSGIEEKVRSKLFDPFFTTKPVGKGTGLGLSISYQIVVDRHGGKIDCYSELERGTEFVIQIPVKQLFDGS